MSARTDARLLGAAFSGGYGGGYPFGGRSNLVDLIMARGMQQAEATRANGAMWGDAINSIGQNISGAIMQADAQKKEKARDKAWADYVEGGTWASNPKEAYSTALKIGGPDLADKWMRGLAGVSQIAQPKRDPQADTQAIIAMHDSMASVDEPTRARQWAQAVPLLKSRYPDLPFTPEYSPQQWAMSESIIGQIKPKPEAPKTREIRTRNADGSETVRIVADTPGQDFTSAAEPGKPQVVGRALVQDGKVIYRDPEPPREPKEPKLVPVKTVNAAGQSVTKYVTPTPGAEYVEPTGQGKPATGQQRRALSFFNRAKEADEIAVSLEDNGELSPTRQKYTPEWANFSLPSSDQRYKQAQRAFTEARLRKESGATIKDEEYQNDAVTYFPQPGDSAETKAQKRSMRQAVLAGIAQESGDALREFYGDEATGMVDRYRAASHQKAGDGLSPEDAALLKAYGF